ncbi:MAG: C2H2-type zinc finger protein [Dehalococcoidales bacterium]|nr:C2H2-type zinc finger protein [Dehalococcoidales bacterium]
MPKLSNKTLENMFPCPHCAKHFRTRQGLSGHIQFKHKQQKNNSTNELMNEIEEMNDIVKTMVMLKVPQAEINSVILINKRWLEIKALCRYFNITPNNQDYKNYVIFSLANK